VDLLVNASALGLKGESFAPGLIDCLKADGAIYDMVYGADSTPLVRFGHEQGLLAADGLGMLAGQGEAAFKLWFGQPSPEGLMRQILVAAIDPSAG
jgi:shikimate dehydrogenase